MHTVTAYLLLLWLARIVLVSIGRREREVVKGWMRMKGVYRLDISSVVSIIIRV
jgi:hypothetical protein